MRSQTKNVDKITIDAARRTAKGETSTQRMTEKRSLKRLGWLWDSPRVSPRDATSRAWCSTGRIIGTCQMRVRHLASRDSYLELLAMMTSETVSGLPDPPILAKDAKAVGCMQAHSAHMHAWSLNRVRTRGLEGSVTLCPRLHRLTFWEDP